VTPSLMLNLAYCASRHDGRFELLCVRPRRSGEEIQNTHAGKANSYPRLRGFCGIIPMIGGMLMRRRKSTLLDTNKIKRGNDMKLHE
jgi:hypothetical protein